MFIGVDSVNQSSLDLVGKTQNTVSEYYRLLKSIRDNGLSAMLSMIVGLDKDDESIFNDTVKFVSDIKPFMIIIGVPIPYPGTEMAEKLEAENRILHKDWSKYRGYNAVFTPKLLSKNQLEKKSISAVRKLYTVQSIIMRSLNQPLRNILSSIFSDFVIRKIVYEEE